MITLVSEFLATLLFVLLGLGIAALGGATAGTLGVALSFGVALFVALLMFGKGLAVTANPALSLALAVNRTINFKSFLLSVVGQFAGALVGGLLVVLVVQSTGLGGVAYTGLAQNGYFELSPARLSMPMTIAIEVVLSFFLAFSYCGAKKREDNSVVIAATQGLLFFVCYMLLIPLDGGGLNPARSLASNLFYGGDYLSQVWLFIAAPLVGGLLAGLFTMTRKQPPVEQETEDEDEIPAPRKKSLR